MVLAEVADRRAGARSPPDTVAAAEKQRQLVALRAKTPRPQVPKAARAVAAIAPTLRARVATSALAKRAGRAPASFLITDTTSRLSQLASRTVLPSLQIRAGTSPACSEHRATVPFRAAQDGEPLASSTVNVRPKWAHFTTWNDPD